MQRILTFLIYVVISLIFLSLLSIQADAVEYTIKVDGAEYTEEQVFGFWIKREKSDAEYTDIGEVINWAGISFTKKEGTTFTKEERKRIVDYVQNRLAGFSFGSHSVVYKEDLNGDGKIEYIATLVIKPAQPFYYGEVVAIIIPQEKDFIIRLVSKPLRFGLGLIVSLQFVDIDGDGLKDIVEQREDEGMGSYNVFDGVIYKNNGMTFHEIYRRRNYGHLQFKDLNGDGRLEILEIRNESPVKTGSQKEVAMEYFEPKWQWINIYEWDGVKLQQVNEKHLSFYLERQKLYRELIEEAKREIELRQKRKLKAIDSEEAIETMKFYTDRIEKMKLPKKPEQP